MGGQTQNSLKFLKSLQRRQITTLITFTFNIFFKKSLKNSQKKKLIT